MTANDNAGVAPPPRVAVVYQILHHFRDPVFSRLVARGPEFPEYRFFASPTNNLDSNLTIDPGRANRPIHEGGLPWTFLRNLRLPGPFLWQSGVLKAARSAEYDVVIFLGNMYYLSTWIGALAARLTGKRVLFWGHGFRKPEANFQGWLRSKFYSIGHGMLLYGPRARTLLQKRGFASQDLYVVYNSLDYEAQRSIREATPDSTLDDLRKTLFVEPERPILVCVGRLDARKQLDVLVDAIASDSAADEPDSITANLLLIGDGDARADLERRVEERGVSDFVHFEGPCYDESRLGPLLMASDLCVCPGDVGLTVVHAMAYGIPVLSHDDFDSQGPEIEAIRRGETGDLYRAGDPAQMKRKIREWIQSHFRDERIRNQCIGQIETHYTADRQAQRIDAAVRGVPAEQSQ